MAEAKKENWFKRTWGKVCKFFRELKSELKKVVWPTPKQVVKNTLIVVVAVIIIGATVSLFDLVAGTAVTALINAVHALQG